MALTVWLREAEGATEEELTLQRQQAIVPIVCNPLEAVCSAAVKTASDQEATLIVVLTETSDAPRLLSK